VFCVICGARNPEYANYCFACGKQLVRADTRVSESPSGPASTRAMSPRSPSVTAPQPTTNSSVAHRPSVEIRPKSLRNGILAVLGCSIFTIGGAFMLASGEPKTMLAGLLSIVFFGGFGLFSIPKIMRRKISFVLTSDGLKQVAPAGSAYIAWSDIESIGVVSIFRTRLVGVRLKTYDRYIASVSPEMADFFRKSLPAMKVIARATSFLDVPDAVKLWSTLAGKEDPADVLKSFGKTGTFVEALLWNRTHYEYDLLWGWSDIDRSAHEFAGLLEQYRVASG
jgi:hypothetical protein